MDIANIRYVEVDGLRIRYLKSAEQAGIPVVLTSPWPESMFAFSKIWQDLTRSFSAIAFDLPGFGLSEGRPDLMSPQSTGNFIPKILRALGLERVHAVAPDVGTGAFLFAASNAPELFESLVVGTGLTDPSLASGALKDIMGAPSMEAFDGMVGEEFASTAISRMMKTPPAAAIMADYRAASANRRFLEAIKYVRAYGTDLPVLRSRLAGIKTPVLGLWGGSDPIVPPSNAAVLQEGLPACKAVVLEGGGHFIWEDNAAEYAAALLEWLKGGYAALSRTSRPRGV